jgi:hypothetical protein
MTATLQITKQKCRVALRRHRHLWGGAGAPRVKAGDGTRTHDILLGKQAFYH